MALYFSDTHFPEQKEKWAVTYGEEPMNSIIVTTKKKKKHF